MCDNITKENPFSEAEKENEIILDQSVLPIGEERVSFMAEDENGNIKEFEIILMYSSEETGKTYAVYTDNEELEDSSIGVYASIIEGEVDDPLKNPILLPIESEKEWRLIEIMLEETQYGMDESNDDDDWEPDNS